MSKNTGFDIVTVSAEKENLFHRLLDSVIPHRSVGVAPRLGALICAAFFMMYLSMASWFPYFGPFLKMECGFSDRLIGLTCTFGALVGVIFQFVWGWLGDKTGKRQRVAAGLLLGSVVPAMVMMQVRENSLVMSMFLLNAALFPSALALADSTALGMLGPMGRPAYSKIRMWGTIGFLAGIPLMGPVLDRFGLKWMCFGYSVALVPAAILLLRVPTTGAHRHVPYRKSLRYILTHRSFQWLMFAGLLASVSLQLGLTFFSMYAEELGASNANIGLLWTAAAGPEVVLFLFVAMIARRVGIPKMIALGMLLSAVRFGFASQVDSWKALLPLQFLHAPATCFTFAGVVMLADRLSPPEIGAGTQAIRAICFYNIAILIGAPLAGEIAERFGYSTLMMCAAVLSVPPALIMLFLVRDPDKSKEAIVSEPRR